MSDAGLACQEESRRDDVRAKPSLCGFDYVDVSEDQLTLTVYFLGKAPTDVALRKENIRIAGGRRVRDLRVMSVRVQRENDPARDDRLVVTVDRPGDFSSYTLSVVALDAQGQPTPMPGFDRRYDKVSFSFKASCPTDLDCKPAQMCPQPTRPQPEINYLAKDYQSFRQLLMDRLATTLPAWRETHAPDLGVALVELLAYVGDYLSYYQDAVATEAYLETARQRISVRRHARLVDYALSEGCNARAWVTIAIKGAADRPPDPAPILLDPRYIFFITSYPGAPDSGVLEEDALDDIPVGAYEAFEPLVEDASAPIVLYQAHGEIKFYTWGDRCCCLPKGATAATLLDQWIPGASDARAEAPPGAARALNLKAGDFLIFEEVIGPKTGNPDDADPRRRQAVRLTKVTLSVDPLYDQKDYSGFGLPLVEIEWRAEDALAFPLCLSAQKPPPDCDCLENISVARGNVILVDHGRTTRGALGVVPTQSTQAYCTECGPSESVITPGVFRPKAADAPLTFSATLPSCGGARDRLTQDVRQALPQMTLAAIPPAPFCAEAEAPRQIAPLFDFADLDDPAPLAGRLKRAADPGAEFLRGRLGADTQSALAAWDGSGRPPPTLLQKLVHDLTALIETWRARPDLLESGPRDAHFVVEIDNDGYAHLRFGDGALGRAPPAGASFKATYRLGNGPAGNVGAGTIRHLVCRRSSATPPRNLVPCNPLPARGGTAPETIAQAKFFAPYAFRDVLQRAIVADDYAALARDNARRLKERAALFGATPADVEPRGHADADDARAAIEEEPGEATPLDACAAPFRALQGAKGALRWTGSWYAALVAVDPLGAEEADAELLSEVAAYLEPYRRIGHDLDVTGAHYVALDLGLAICVSPDYLRGHVEAALLDVFSNRVLPDGRLGFFHPDALSFGEAVYVSRIVAAAQATPGVQNVEVTRLERYEIGEAAPGLEAAAEEVPSDGVLWLAPFEIARLDDDPSFPENGRLTLKLRGGR